MSLGDDGKPLKLGEELSILNSQLLIPKTGDIFYITSGGKEYSMRMVNVGPIHSVLKVVPDGTKE